MTYFCNAAAETPKLELAWAIGPRITGGVQINRVFVESAVADLDDRIAGPTVRNVGNNNLPTISDGRHVGEGY